MAESSAVSEIFVKETVAGVTPVDSTNWFPYPLSGAGGLGATPVKSESNRVRSDRGKSQPNVVGFDVNGSYAAADFKSDQWDPFFESALSSTFGASVAGELTNASELQTFTSEREFTDLTDKYLKYRGAAVNTMTLDFATLDSPVTVALDMVAMSHDSDDTTSSVGAGSIQTETTNKVITVLGLSNLTLGGVTGYCIETGSIQTNNNLTPKKCSGQNNGNAVDLRQGTFEVTGSIAMHTTDNSWALLAARDNSDGLDFSFDLSDGTNIYTFTFPNVTVEFPDPTGEAANTSVLLNVNLDAFQEDGSYTLRITKA